ncbi:DUF1707 domain-containing protein [Corynebacterium sp. 13CS0277]|uniref:DUF1707 domain-containing protein n=1 Tax=Corynebacterium sp. 13CS0277 TaxID=2071994 RepID=UPI00130500CE|nr:DUF1707 domain-containing protein [Corynebacterium sp. 13CS0277]
MDAYDAHELRVCDADRAIALDTLTALTGRGFLTIAEFEERSSRAAAATTRADLDELFRDIPPGALQHPAQTPAAVAGGVQPASYNQATMAPGNQRVSGAAIRGGLTLLALVIISNLPFTPDGLQAVMIVGVLLALWVFKVGPARWYAPSQKQLMERQHHLQLQMRTEQTRVERELAAEQNRLLQEQARLSQQQFTTEVTDAMTQMLRQARQRFGQK